MRFIGASSTRKARISIQFLPIRNQQFMEIATGSDHALIFFNYIIDQLFKNTCLIKVRFTAGITLDERLDIINALQQQKHVFNDDKPWKVSLKMIWKINYDVPGNKITVLANPLFLEKLRQTSLIDWR
jgi:hypothetical protein